MAKTEQPPYMPPPTKEFCDELLRRARAYGWSGDYVEIVDFVQEMYRLAGLPVPSRDDLEPVPPS